MSPIQRVLAAKHKALNEHYGEGVITYRLLKHEILHRIKDYMAFQVFLCPGALEEDCFYDALRYLRHAITHDNKGYKGIRKGFLEECREAVG